MQPWQLVKIVDPEKKVRHLTKLFLEYEPWMQSIAEEKVIVVEMYNFMNGSS